MRGVTPGSTLRLTHEVNMSESMGIGRVWNIVSVGLFVFATTCLVWQSAINPSLPSCGELSITLNGVTIRAIKPVWCNTTLYYNKCNTFDSMCGAATWTPCNTTLEVTCKAKSFLD